MVPARGGSKRLPRKNITSLCGRPLISWTLDAAKDAHDRFGVFDEIHVSTEDPEVRAVAEGEGFEPRFERPRDLDGDRVGVVDVLLATLDTYEREHGMAFDEVCVLLPTSPLRTGEDVRAAVEAFSAQPDAEALMTLKRFDGNPLAALRMDDAGAISPHWGRETLLTKRQDSPPLWVHCGSVCLCRVAALRAQRTYYCRRLIGIETPAERAVDIDEPIDLRFAEFLMTERLAGAAA